jgi:hypothetical protein
VKILIPSPAKQGDFRVICILLTYRQSITLYAKAKLFKHRLNHRMVKGDVTYIQIGTAPFEVFTGCMEGESVQFTVGASDQKHQLDNLGSLAENGNYNFQAVWLNKPTLNPA